jgi:hypothetical protein
MTAGQGVAPRGGGAAFGGGVRDDGRHDFGSNEASPAAASSVGSGLAAAQLRGSKDGPSGPDSLIQRPPGFDRIWLVCPPWL